AAHVVDRPPADLVRVVGGADDRDRRRVEGMLERVVGHGCLPLFLGGSGVAARGREAQQRASLEFEETGLDRIADREAGRGMAHHARAFFQLDDDDGVGHERAPRRRGRPHHLGARVDRAPAARPAPLERRGPAARAGMARQRLRMPAGGAGLVADLAPGQALDEGSGGGMEGAHESSRANTRLTWEDITPPSAWTKARRRPGSCRSPARPASWRKASTACPMPPATPQWPNESRPPWVLSGSGPSSAKSPSRSRRAQPPRGAKPISSRRIASVIVNES